LANLNQIYLLGNLTRDPELRYTNEGMAITEMGMAVNKRWKDANGDENSVVDFFNITVWNHLAENCAGSLKKGDRIMVGGHLNLRSWENKDGKKYNIVNITADVVASSLEFNKAYNHEARVNGVNSYEGRPEKIDSGVGSEKTDSFENRLTSINSSNEIDVLNNNNGPDGASGIENRMEKTNIKKNMPDNANWAVKDLDKIGSGSSRQYRKNKNKEPEKKLDSASIAQDMAADYSLEVINK
jgi:single-strand DNA-binding protein